MARQQQEMTMAITPDELKAMEERCEKATPEPWYGDPDGAEECEPNHGVVWVKGKYGRTAIFEICYLNNADIEFTAHSRTDMPRLIAEVKRLREALTKIHTYRSDKPDWNMVMAIAEEAINPMEIVPS